MSTFKNNGITMQGAVAMAALVAGGTLEFTRISVGDGELTSNQTPMTMKDLNHRLFDVNINEVYSDSEAQATVIGVFNNSQTQTGFFYRELGLFAKDPATGAEILYCYGNAGTEAEWISPAGEESVIEKEVHIVTLIGGATTVTASLKSGIYPTIEQTQKWLAEKYDKTGGPINGDVQISGTTSMKGGLNVEGGTTTDTINITGKATINGGVSITGGASVDEMTVTGSLTVPMPEKDTDAANQEFVNQQIENKTEFKKLEFVNPEIIKGQAPAEAKQVGIEYFGKEKGTKEARLASLIYQLSADMTAALQMMVNDPKSTNTAGIIVSFKDGKPRLALTNHPEAASNDHSIATTNWVRGIRATAEQYGLVRVADQEDVLKDDCGDAAIVPAVYHDVSDYRHKNTTYVVGDIVRCMFNSELFLECTKAGTTSAEPLDTRAVKHNQILEDGTCNGLLEPISRVLTGKWLGKMAMLLYLLRQSKISQALGLMTVMTHQQGFYYCRPTDYEYENFPTTSHGVLVTVKDVGTPFQEYHEDNSTKIWTRKKQSGADWGRWTKNIPVYDYNGANFGMHANNLLDTATYIADMNESNGMPFSNKWKLEVLAYDNGSLTAKQIGTALHNGSVLTRRYEDGSWQDWCVGPGSNIMAYPNWSAAIELDRNAMTYKAEKACYIYAVDIMSGAQDFVINGKVNLYSDYNNTVVAILQKDQYVTWTKPTGFSIIYMIPVILY